FAVWLPPEEITYASDPLIDAMHSTELPYRTWDPAGATFGAAGMYQGSILMGHKVPSVFGYHGMESRFYDEVWGGKNVWVNQLSPSLHNLWATRYLVTSQPLEAVPGFRQVMGPVSFPNMMGRIGPAGFLWESETLPQWVRVVGGAFQVPEAQIAATVADPNYPVDRVALFADTASVDGASTTPAIPE